MNLGRVYECILMVEDAIYRDTLGWQEYLRSCRPFLMIAMGIVFLLKIFQESSTTKSMG